MIADNTLVNFTFQRNVGSGDVDKRGAEHRSFLKLNSFN